MDGVDGALPAPPADASPGRLARLLAGLGRALLPPRCLVCAEPGAHGLDLCAACRAALPRPRCACPRCALPLAGPELACGACLREPPAMDRVLAACHYAFPVDRLLPRFKFHGDLAAGRTLSALLAEAVAPVFDAPGAVLVPVPLHPARLRERGYNQALELARPLASRFGLALAPGLLQRRRPTGPQTGLDAAGRRSNVRGAFHATGKAPDHVVLVDDVMTTGSTLAECTRALRRAGASRVDAWVAARVA